MRTLFEIFAECKVIHYENLFHVLCRHLITVVVKSKFVMDISNQWALNLVVSLGALPLVTAQETGVLTHITALAV